MSVGVGVGGQKLNLFPTISNMEHFTRECSREFSKIIVLLFN